MGQHMPRGTTASRRWTVSSTRPVGGALAEEVRVAIRADLCHGERARWLGKPT